MAALQPPLQVLVLAVAAEQAMVVVTVEIARYPHQIILAVVVVALEATLALVATQAVQAPQVLALVVERVVGAA